jgi:hypothetical protein
MTDRFELTQDVKDQIADFRVSFEDTNARITPYRFEASNNLLPASVARYLPENTSLRQISMDVEELGSRSTAPGLQLTIPFGPRRAAVRFE